MVTKKEVQHVALLARLGMAKKDEEKFSKELSAILGYVEKLKKADIQKTEPTFHPSAFEGVKREDRSGDGKAINSRKLLEIAPETKDGYIKVESILK